MQLTRPSEFPPNASEPRPPARVPVVCEETMKLGFDLRAISLL
jgi:hypothetical protein